jgi:two-component system, NtrC family, response regulator HydG
MQKAATSRKLVLLVDDEEIYISMATLALRQAHIKDVDHLNDSRQVMRFLAENQVAVVLLDLQMPHVSGRELLKSIRQEHPGVHVVIVTASKDIDIAIECMKLGAIDYLVKPVDASRLQACVKNALQLIELQHEVAMLKNCMLDDNLNMPAAFSAIVTRSKKMRSIFKYIEAVAPSQQSILITGETGVGKELIAGAIHLASGVKGECITVNVAGLDDVVFSDTLFGHKKGAFTGAESAREGLISRAAGGTLFLDEIGDLNEASQIKLLRLLQQNEYYPVGSDIVRKSTARIVVATNVELDSRIADGRFRRDLYYRLCTHQVYVPPLRQRTEDIHLLASHFVEQASRHYGKSAVIPIAPNTITYLQTCHFPGNVRELQAVINDAVARHTSGPLLPTDFSIPKENLRSGGKISGGNEATATFVLHFDSFPTSREVEERHLQESVALANGDHNLAALYMGVSRKTIDNRLKACKQKTASS